MLLFLTFVLTTGCDEPEKGRYDYKGPVEGSAGQDPSPPSDEPAAEEKDAPVAEADEGGEAGGSDDGPNAGDDDLDLRDNWVVWPGAHVAWVDFNEGATSITREGIEGKDAKAQTMVCNKPGAAVEGTSARVVGRWKYAIDDGVGRVSVRFFAGDQPVKEGSKRLSTDLSIGKDGEKDWTDVDQWVDIPAGTDNVRYCLALKGSDAAAWSDDLRIAEWK